MGQDLPHNQRFGSDFVITQLFNDISTSLALDETMLHRDFAPVPSWRRFEKLLHTASQRLDDTGGILAIAVDAIDNAVTAYEKASSTRHPCPVPALWDIDLPSNIKLLMTCRTGRRDLVKAPSNVQQIELSGFSEDDTTEFMRQQFPSLSDETYSRIHQITRGNPRLQFYWRDQLSSKSNKDIEHEIATKPSWNLVDLYEDWLDSLAIGNRSGRNLQEVLAVLVSLRHPIQLDVFAGVLGISAASACNIIDGLKPGLVESERSSEFTFLDEDFETHLDSKVDDSARQDAHREIADYCLAHKSENGYCARWAHHHLWHSQQYRKCIELALEQDQYSALDSFFVPDCVIDRCAAGLRACGLADTTGTAVKILFVAAEEIRRKDLLANALIDQPNLALAHGRKDAFAQAFESHMHDSDHDGFWLNLAHALSKEQEFKSQARRCLELGQAWMQSELDRSRQNKNRFHSIQFDDIVQETLAILYLDGPRAAETKIKAWNPRTIWPRLAFECMSHLKIGHDNRHLDRLLAAIDPLSITQASCLAGLYYPGKRRNKAKLDDLAAKLVRLQRRHPELREFFGPWVLSFAELCLASNVSSALVGDILEIWVPPTFDYPHTPFSADDWSKHWDPRMRYFALKSHIKANELTPENILDLSFAPDPEREEDDHFKQRKKELLENLPVLIDAYLLRAECIAKGRWSKKIGSRILTASHRVRDRMARPWRWPAALNPVVARVLADAFMAARGTDQEIIAKILAKGDGHLGYNRTSTMLEIARELACDRRLDDVLEWVLSEIDVSASTSTMVASERISLLIEAAKIAICANEELSNELYEKASRVSTSIDENAPKMLGCTFAGGIALARKGGADSGLATSLAKLFKKTYPFIEDERYVPWDTAIEAIARLDPGVGIDTILDWDRRGWRHIQSGSSMYIEGCASAPNVSWAELRSMLRLINPLTDKTAVSVRVLDRMFRSERIVARAQFRELVELTLRDCPVRDRLAALQRLRNWAESESLPASDTKLLKEAIEFYSLLDKNAEGDSVYTTPSRVKPINLARIRRLPPTKAYDRLIALLESDSYVVIRDGFMETLLEVTKKLPSAKRADALDNLLQSSAIGAMGNKRVLDVVLTLLPEWKKYSGVKKWCETRLVDHLKIIIPRMYDYWSEFRHEYLKTLLGYITSDEAKQTATLSTAIGESLRDLNSDNIHVIARAYFDLLGGESVEEALRWNLERHQCLTTFTESSTTGYESPARAARLTWSLLNNPDNRIKWQAVHYAREYAEIDPEPFIEQLSQYLDDDTAEYWMSARQWLLFIVLTWARSNPSYVVPLLPLLMKIALDEGFPHAVHQELAKKSCQIVCTKIPDSADPEIVAQFSTVNAPRSCLVGSEYSFARKRPHSNPDLATTFDFDSMDTLRYWYDRLADCFALDQYYVTEIADRWISETWGVSNTDCVERDPRNLGGHSWYSYKNDHGALPTLERKSTYFEFHGMCMAAGELIRSRSVYVDQWESVRWGDWLRSYSMDADVSITSRFRAYPSLHRKYFTICPSTRPGPDSSFKIDEYVDSILQTRDGRAGLLVYSDYYTDSRDETLYTDILCALVNGKTATALRRALDNKSNPYDFRLPSHAVHLPELDALNVYPRNMPDGDGEAYCEISSVDGFELRPLVLHVDTENQLDKTDPYWPESHRGWSLLSPEYLKLLGYSFVLPEFAVRDEKQRIVAQSRTWNDNLREHAEYLTYSRGQTLWVDMSSILRILKSKNLTLVGTCLLRLNARESPRSAGDEYDPGKEKAFVIRQDGRIEIGDRIIRPRTGNSPRTRSRRPRKVT